MSQTELEAVVGGPSPTKPNLSEFSPQTLYDKCLALARNLWWTWHPEVINLFRDLDPIRWRQLDHNPDRAAGRVHARAAGDAGGGAGALQPHQLCLSPAEGIHGQHADLGHARTPACWARSRWPISRPSSASTSRCRFTPAAWACSRATTSKAPAAWACRWSPSACSTIRAISSSTSTSTATSSEEYLDTKVENVPMEPARRRRTASRSRFEIDTRTGQLFAKVWLMHVGRVRLVPARLRRRRQQPGRPRADQPAVRRRPSHAHSPGTGAGRRRREGAAAPGHLRPASIT